TYEVPITAEIYARIKEGIGPQRPPGLIAHLAYRTESGLRYVEIWQAKDDWEAFEHDRVHPVVHPLLQDMLGFVPPEPPRTVLETNPVHQERRARLTAELGLETSGGPGHEPQHERGNVAWRAGAPGGCLDRGGELVEGEVFGAADLEYAAAHCGVGHGMFDQRGDICNRDEVDRVVPPPEDERPPRA